MKLTSYDNLTPSEVIDGLELPEHWRKVRFRHLFIFDRGLGITKANLKDEGIPCVNYGEIHSRLGFEVIPERDTLKYVDEDYLEIGRNSLLTRGDFVFADTSEDLEGSGNFTYLNSDETTFAGYHTVIARLQSNDEARFIAYLFSSQPFRTQIRQRVSGVKVFSITQAILKSSALWLPTNEEQSQIADYLDYKTIQIDKLIKNKEALIEILDEQSLTMITEAVTKGLNPDMPMKDSDIDWLGQVPKHWGVTRLKHVTHKIIDGAHFTPTYVSEGIPFLRVTDIVKSKGKGINLDGVKFIPASEHEELIKRCNPEKGDVLYSKNGTIGIPRVIDWDWDFSVFVSLSLLKTEKNKINSNYLAYYLTSKVTQNQIEIGAKSNTVTNLHLDKIREFIVTLPSLDEQKSIVNKLDLGTKKINDMIAANLKTVERLKEYRTALITSAVTGKIDLRDVDIPEGL